MTPEFLALAHAAGGPAFSEILMRDVDKLLDEANEAAVAQGATGLDILRAELAFFMGRFTARISPKTPPETRKRLEAYLLAELLSAFTNCMEHSR